jgi:hypothetical protein
VLLKPFTLDASDRGSRLSLGDEEDTEQIHGAGPQRAGAELRTAVACTVRIVADVIRRQRRRGEPSS